MRQYMEAGGNSAYYANPPDDDAPQTDNCVVEAQIVRAKGSTVLVEQEAPVFQEKP